MPSFLLWFTLAGSQLAGLWLTGLLVDGMVDTESLCGPSDLRAERSCFLGVEYRPHIFVEDRKSIPHPRPFPTGLCSLHISFPGSESRLHHESVVWPLNKLSTSLDLSLLTNEVYNSIYFALSWGLNNIFSGGGGGSALHIGNTEMCLLVV